MNATSPSDALRPAPTLACAERGSGHAVVLLHGIPGSAAVWDAVAADLATDHLVLCPDLVGFGGSPRARSIDELDAGAQAAALARLLDERGVERAALVGHDYGGPVALTLAARRPELVSHVALAATNAFPDTPIPLPIAAVTWPLVGGLAARALFSAPSLRMMLRQGAGKGAPPLDPEVYVGDAGQRHAIATIFAAALRELRERYEPVEAALATLRAPVLVAWGDRDPFFPLAQAERTARAAGARLAVYPGCGHFVPAERPHELAADVRALVAGAARAAA